MHRFVVATAFVLAATAAGPCFAAGSPFTSKAQIATYTAPSPAPSPFGTSNFISQQRFVLPPCTPGSLGYTHFYGAYGEPEKKDNCTGQISSDY